MTPREASFQHSGAPHTVTRASSFPPNEEGHMLKLTSIGPDVRVTAIAQEVFGLTTIVWNHE